MAEGSKKVASLVAVIGALAGLLVAVVSVLGYIDSQQSMNPKGAASLADCLVGTWNETSIVADATVGGTQVKMTGVGAKQIFTRSGKFTTYFGNGVTRRGTSNGHTYERKYTGAITWDYTVVGDLVVTSNPVANGTRTDTVDGKAGDTTPISVTGGWSDHYACSGDTITTESDGFVATLTRETK